MRINFILNEIQGGFEPDDVRLGGSEDSVVQWAEHLVKRGHKVFVYRNSPDRKIPYFHNGVIYDERKYYNGGGDICINVKSSDTPIQEKTIYLTNEIDADKLDLKKFLGVIWPSEWAEEHIRVNNPLRFIVPYGYDPKRIYPVEKIAKQCLYASSPDRGLEVLLRAWPKVVQAHPDANLYVTYGAPTYDVQNVFFVGNITEDTMDSLYRESEIWCHPCTGIELFCITGLKAQAAGCVPVIIPKMALKETVKHGYFAKQDNYADMLIKALNEPHDFVLDAMAREKYPTWDDSTDRLLEVIKTVLS